MITVTLLLIKFIQKVIVDMMDQFGFHCIWSTILSKDLVHFNSKWLQVYGVEMTSSARIGDRFIT